MFRIVILSLIVFLLSTELLADIVFLRNLKYIKGAIVAVDRTGVTIVSPKGRETISKIKIKRIVYTSDDQQS